MASDKSQLNFVLEQIGRAGKVTARAMFGEYGIYCDGKIVALFCDNQFFVKPTEEGRAYIKSPFEAPPYPGAKPYFLIEDQIEDSAWATELIRITAQNLPLPKKKSKTERSGRPKSRSKGRR